MLIIIGSEIIFETFQKLKENYVSLKRNNFPEHDSKHIKKDNQICQTRIPPTQN